MRSLSVELKLGGAVFATCLAAAVAGAWIAGGIFDRNVESAGLAALRGAADAFAAQERSEVERLAGMIDALLANEELREAFEARDRDRLLALCAPLFATMKGRDRITHWYFIDPEDRTVFLRVHMPELHGDVVDRATLRKAADTRELGAGKELGQTAFALRVVRPWIEQGTLIGYVELAEEIDHFLTMMKGRTGDDYGLIVKKKFLDEQAWARVLGPRSNTWNDRPDVVVVDTTPFTDGVVDHDGDLEALSDRGEALGEIERGDRAYIRGIFPVRDAADRKVGGLFVLHDFTSTHAAMKSASLQTFLVLLAIGLVTAAAIIALARWCVFARLDRLRREVEDRAARQGLPRDRHVHLAIGDEIGRLEGLLRRVLHPRRPREEPDGVGAQSASGERR